MLEKQLQKHKTLIIANQFPPMFSSGVQRSLKFVVFLEKLGEKVVVLTKKIGKGVLDRSLVGEIPKSVKVYHLEPYDLENSGLIKKIWGRFFAIPDAERYWYKKNISKTLEIIDKEKIDTIYTTSYPYSSHLLGLAIKKQRPDIKWIVDYRDEWTNNPFHLDSFYKRIRFVFEKHLEKKVNKTCDYLIANTEFMLKGFIKDTKEVAKKSCVIPNGYDENDFKDAKPLDLSKFLQNKSESEDKERVLRIVHAGALYGRRTLDDFLISLSNCFKRGTIDKNHIRICLAGVIKEENLANYRSYFGTENIIEYLGRLDHKESVELLLRSDVLLLLIGKGKGSENFYTGKLFEYLRAKKPIFAIVPKNGAAGMLITKTKSGQVIDPEDLKGIETTLENMYNSFLKKEPFSGFSPDFNEIKKYSRLEQARELQKIIHKLHNN